MRNNSLHTPVGVRDLLPKESEIKSFVTKKIENVFKSYGFETVESPEFEFLEVFSDENKGSTDPKQMYKFIERDGSTLALRSDMTPPIARIAATVYGDTEDPIRLSYFGNTCRYYEEYQGRARQEYQAGIELIGVNSVEADAEVLVIAVNSLLETGLTDFNITIGQVEFFKGILEETNLSQDDKRTLYECVAQRDYVSVEKIIEEKNLPEDIKEIFINLPKMYGDFEILEYAQKITKNEVSKKSIQNLMELYKIIEYYGYEKYITFDLSMVSNLNYYTGIIFRGYTEGIGYHIVSGGRYDNLVGQYGKNKEAVGFSLKLSDIISLIIKKDIEIETKKITALICYKKEGMKSALLASKKFRETGLYIENGLLGDDLNKNIEYAKSKNMSHVLYFLDDENIKMAMLTGEAAGTILYIKNSDLTVNSEGDD